MPDGIGLVIVIWISTALASSAFGFIFGYGLGKLRGVKNEL